MRSAFACSNTTHCFIMYIIHYLLLQVRGICLVISKRGLSFTYFLTLYCGQFSFLLLSVYVGVLYKFCTFGLKFFFSYREFFSYFLFSVTGITPFVTAIVSLGNGFLKLFHPFFLRNMTAKTKPFIYGYALKFVSNQSNWSHNH